MQRVSLLYFVKDFLDSLPFRIEVFEKVVTMRLSEDVVEYFKGMADDAGGPYQSFINLYLRDCLANSRKVQINWPSAV